MGEGWEWKVEWMLVSGLGCGIVDEVGIGVARVRKGECSVSGGWRCRVWEWGEDGWGRGGKIEGNERLSALNDNVK